MIFNKYINLIQLFKIALLVICIFLKFNANANNIMGADITYKCMSNLKFKVNIKMYRFCGGDTLSAPDFVVKCKRTGRTFNYNLSSPTITDITPNCSKVAKRCSPKNTNNTAEGIEEHSYQLILDFNLGSLDSLYKNGSCIFYFGTGKCCRNSNITTGAAGENFWTTAMIDLCKATNNHSPNLTSKPISLLCCNQPYYYNLGASDTLDYDSLSYEWDHPLVNWTKNTSWSGSYSANNPFTYLKQGTTINPNIDPPIGLHLDPIRGDIIFTPSKCDESSIVTIKIVEWRRDSSSKKWEIISEIKRDMQFMFRSCPANNPPIINGPYKFQVCAESQLCFTINADDKQYIPPPPAPSNPPDTVKLKWNKGIPDASFNIIDFNARLQSAKFCWAPTQSQYSSLPYYFVVSANDNACPINATSLRSFSVRVKHKAKAKHTIETLSCGLYRIESLIFSDFINPAKYNWRVLDSIGAFVGRSSAYFKSNNGVISKQKFDTVQFRKGGKYIIEHVINNAENCPSIYYDTIIVPNLLEVDIHQSLDTFLCSGTSLKINASHKNALPNYQYQWYNPSKMINDTLNEITFTLNTKDTTFRIEISDDSKCVAWDTITIFNKANPIIDMGADKRICSYDSFALSPYVEIPVWINPLNDDTLLQSDSLWWTWRFNGTSFSTDTIATLKQEGIYTISVIDSFGCIGNDTFQLIVNSKPNADAGLDRSICMNQTLILSAQGLDTFSVDNESYQWYLLNNDTQLLSTKKHFETKINANTTYKLILLKKEDSITCFDLDTVNITVIPIPVINLKASRFCCNDSIVNINNSEFCKPLGGTWECKSKPDLVDNNWFNPKNGCISNLDMRYTLSYTYKDSITQCQNTDSAFFDIVRLPPAKLRDQSFCQDSKEISLNDQIIKPTIFSIYSVNWNLIKDIDKTGGGKCKLSDLVFEHPSFQHRLRVGNPPIELGTKEKDSLMLELIITDGNGCVNRDTGTYYIHKVPKITFTGFPPLCINSGIVDLNVISNIKPLGGKWFIIDTVIPPIVFKKPYLINPGLNLPNGDTLNTYKLNKQTSLGTYFLRYKYHQTFCFAKRDTVLQISALPIVSARLDSNVICENASALQLFSNPSGGIWHSNISGINIFNQQQLIPEKIPISERHKPILLHYTYQNPDTKCSASSDTHSVEILPAPMANFFTNPDSKSISGWPKFNFIDSSTIQNHYNSYIKHYNWDFGENHITSDSSSLINPTYIYRYDTGSYLVTLKVASNHHCKDSITKLILVNNGIIIHIPNVFSPNKIGPEENNQFNVYVSGHKSYEIVIYNTLGEMMFYANNSSEKWDGTFKNKACQDGNYLYYIKVTDSLGQLQTYKGLVLLLK